MSGFEICYMCNEVATSREHVPPKCLFPERKDIGGDYRKDLVTVPSCDKHNSMKSKDDEFLMVSLAGIIGNNSIGLHHKFGKVDRAIRRSSNRLLEKVFLRRKHFVVELDENKFIEIIWGTPDHVRLVSCFEHIAYGIYYNHFKTRFSGEVKILLGYLHSDDQNTRTFRDLVKHKCEIELKDKPLHGENKEIFYYQFTEPDEFGLFALNLCFYGGLNIFAGFLPSTEKMPFNLAIELLKAGIETHVSLDGNDYVFNKI